VCICSIIVSIIVIHCVYYCVYSCMCIYLVEWAASSEGGNIKGFQLGLGSEAVFPVSVCVCV
jgi:hypothetical protein